MGVATGRWAVSGGGGRCTALVFSPSCLRAISTDRTPFLRGTTPCSAFPGGTTPPRPPRGCLRGSLRSVPLRLGRACCQGGRRVRDGQPAGDDRGDHLGD